ncbi:MAG TPA: SgcJ/EcaC family oxidoreductase [Pseudonocardiaceae bacterium]|nr:SgcJ/EcaC family oxidoreductase [Pseudonocardiaceae bacterium]
MTSSNATFVWDDGALRRVLDGVYTALADNDADAFVAFYADEAIATFSGCRLPNREAIRTCMAIGFAGPLMGFRGIIEIDSIRFISADAVIAFSGSALLFPGEIEALLTGGCGRLGRCLARNGTWPIVAALCTRTDPPPGEEKVSHYVYEIRCLRL